MNSMLTIQTRAGITETFDSGSGDARKRASDLRKLGYHVIVSPLGRQVTHLGVMKLTQILTVNPDDNYPSITEER